MQKLLAVVVPLCAVLWGLVTLRAVRKEGRRLGDPAAIGAVLFIAYGALTLNNLSLRGLSLLGSKLLGYGPRYGCVADLAGACLFLAPARSTASGPGDAPRADA
jgi:hypothetical protein